MEKYMIIHLSMLSSPTICRMVTHAKSPCCVIYVNMLLCLFKVTMSLTTKERRPHRVPPFFSSPHKNRLL